MTKERSVNADLTHAVSVKAGALFSLNASSKLAKESGTGIIDTDDLKHGSEEWARWGSDNLFPQNFYADVKKNTILKSALDFKARAICSEFQYGTVSYGENGEEQFLPVKDPVVESFIKKTRLYSTYLLPASLDFVYFGVIFPEIIMSLDRKSIVNISRQKAAHSRITQMNKSGFSEYTLINANWETFGPKEEEYTVRLPNIDVDYDPASFVQINKAKRYIYPVVYPSIDESYYPVLPQNSFRESGWYDVAKSIPAYKKAYYENSVTLRYHIEIADWWWEKRYPDFFKKDSAYRKEKIDEVLDDFEDRMTSADKAFKTVTSMLNTMDFDGEERSGWKITPLKADKADKGDLETSQEASQHAMFSLGMHPSIMGSTPGGKLNTSGSEQRVALNNFYIINRVHQKSILDPVQFIFDFNGWNYEPRFKNPLIHTLDQGNEITESNL